MNITHRQTMLVLLVALAMLVAGYWLVRYGGWNVEGDAMRLRRAAEATIAQERLVTTEASYSNGYGFQTLLAVLAVTTGSDPAAMQAVTTFWLAAVAIAAFMLYWRLLADEPLAMLGAVVLMMMPDFLYPVLRASHERITWTFSMLLMALWLRNLDTLRPLRVAALVSATYLLFWAMIAANVFMASTVLAAIAFALLLSVIAGSVLSLGERNSRRNRRMAYFLLTGVTLVFLFIFFIYTPSQNYIRALNSVGERLAVILLGIDEMAAPNSVAYVVSAWRGRYTYIVLTMVEYAVVMVSFAAWIKLGRKMISGGRKQISSTGLILWLLYFGIGVQVAIGLLADFSGAMAGNMQVRYMAPFMILAVAMAATWLKGLRFPTFSWQRQRTIEIVGMVVFGLSLAAALLKVTNDPLVSNIWAFYQAQEKRAVVWVDENLSDANVWLDLDPGKAQVLRAEKELGWKPANTYLVYGSGVPPSHFLISDLIRDRALRIGIALPFLESHNRVYDAGQVQIFHRRPLTPFQR